MMKPLSVPAHFYQSLSFIKSTIEPLKARFTRNLINGDLSYV